eukprot:CAMPEP_0175062194 /NCGR_PEP_ID=MMETSP0052_2-20121109/14027_1 /TAXON_ID=51329 ORGANISM="Polytomella parva, Strain SAG 63-3" /NCGR_SAMPLE_ID=MMETSP0052_2 /ASSEMBLY_ACC=CAM_ASM_000194 /LENGTH=359 /DNA_ID=CAMNT_0016328177 /DNA_START=149 /DNA_END=1225 /DNA_ORIENTATION=+
MEEYGGMDLSNRFEAFVPQLICSNLANKKITCLSFWNETLLLGLGDGHLLFMKPPQNPSTTSHANHHIWQVIRSSRSLDRRPYLQVIPVLSRPLLLALTAEGVSLHTLPDMGLRFQATRTKGGSMMAWNEAKRELAVAVKRRLLIFSLSGSDLNESADLALPDVPLHLEWMGELVVVATHRCYLLMTVGPGGCVIAELPNPGAAPTPIAYVPPHTDGGEVLIQKDSTTLFCRADGRPSRSQHITWSGPVVKLLAGEHYAVAALHGMPGLQASSRQAVSTATSTVLCNLSSSTCDAHNANVVSHSNGISNDSGISNATSHPVTLPGAVIEVRSLWKSSEGHVVQKIVLNPKVMLMDPISA